MKMLGSIVLFTFKPEVIVSLLNPKESPLPFLQITKTGHKNPEHGEGFRLTIITEKPNRVLDSLAIGGPSTIPYYTSVCEKGHGAFSNAQMAGRICPRSDCDEKIFRENYYDIRDGREWGPAPESKKLVTETAVG